MKRPRSTLVVIVVSLALVLVGALGYLAYRSNSGATDATSIGSRDLASLQAQIDAQASTPATDSSTPTPAPSTPSGTPAPSGTPIPVHVKVPAIGVSTAVLPVGLDDAGALGIPKDITKVGWYELGVAPGAGQGSAVLVGHRDGVVQGHGVFYDLGSLALDDRIILLDAAGVESTYKVVAREFIKKKKLPLEEIFAIDGPPRLTLISCGGYYDKANGGYQENIVVTAIQERPTA